MCDTIAAVTNATGTGGVLFGKNSDREYNEAQHLELVSAMRYAPGARVNLTYVEIDQVPATYAVLLSKPHWIWGAEIGANEHGLVIGNEALYSKIEASMTDGIIGMDYLRLALERAKSVEEGIHVITSLLRIHGQSGNCGFERDQAYHNSFILADAKGAKVLETIEREWAVTPIQDFYAISNSMTIDGMFESSSPTLKARAVEMGLHKGDLPFGFKTTYEDASKADSGGFRRARAMKLLDRRAGQLQLTDFFEILRDHEEGKPLPGRPTGPRICAHTRENPLGQTTASWVATLAPENIVHWVTGTAAPCTGLFKPVILECGLPNQGPRPRAKEDRASLWWRHEQLRRGLEEASAELRTAFTEERDLLEARFLAAMSGCPAITSDYSRQTAREIVENCWRDGLAFESKWSDLLLR